MKAQYRATSFFCGTCREPLDFMTRRGFAPAAWHVHRNDHRYHCFGRRWWGPNTATARILTDRNARSEPL